MALRIAMTGFVDADAGSMPSANAVLLQELLKLPVEIHFFSKATFVDPRPVAGDAPNFRFTNVANTWTDALRATTGNVPGLRTPTRLLDATCYNRLLVRGICRAHRREPFDVCVWLGDYARGRIPSLPAVSFAQGAPGSDARSLIRRSAEIARLAGRSTAAWWRLLARLRLSGAGLPCFDFSDLVVVGSSQSRGVLRETFLLPDERTASLPYPIDLETFRPASERLQHARKRCLWLGRIVPRKRLDLFLSGMAHAIRDGANLEATIVGRIGFVRGYSKLIEAFPFQDRLTWIEWLPRERIPGLMQAHDVVIQPSEEEDFGSTVAEAQACGLPVIVGQTNGNADYLGKGDVHLTSDDPGELADAIIATTSRRHGSVETSRENAIRHFEKSAIAARFLAFLEKTAGAR